MNILNFSVWEEYKKWRNHSNCKHYSFVNCSILFSLFNHTSQGIIKTRHLDGHCWLNNVLVHAELIENSCISVNFSRHGSATSVFVVLAVWIAFSYAWRVWKAANYWIGEVVS
jgi:hypothetical protein